MSVQPEMMRRLQLLQDQAAQLGALARTLSRSAPDRAEGADATGWVKVTLDGSGVPVEIQVRNGWEQRIEPQQLAAAVGDAHADAVSRGMRAWSESLDDSRWYFQRNVFDNGEEAAEPQAEPVAPTGERREVSELAEEVISELQSAQRAPVPDSPTAEGSDDDKRVTVRLGPEGSVSCSIDQQWVERRGGDSITIALTTALGRARASLPSRDVPSVRIDGLIGDVLATLESFKDQ